MSGCVYRWDGLAVTHPLHRCVLSEGHDLSRHQCRCGASQPCIPTDGLRTVALNLSHVAEASKVLASWPLHCRCYLVDHGGRWVAVWRPSCPVHRDGPVVDESYLA